MEKALRWDLGRPVPLEESMRTPVVPEWVYDQPAAQRWKDDTLAALGRLDWERVEANLHNLMARLDEENERMGVVCARRWTDAPWGSASR